MDRLETSFHESVADGRLARFSVVGPDPASALNVIEAFIPGLIYVTPAPERGALIGTERARAIDAVARLRFQSICI